MDSHVVELLTRFRNDQVTDLQIRSGSGRISMRKGGLYSKYGQALDTEALVQSFFMHLSNDDRLLFEQTGACTTRLAHDAFGVVRVHLYRATGQQHAAMRFLEDEPWALEDLRLPKAVEAFADLGSGLVLITGVPGAGKSTAQASIIRRLYERHRGQHISTVDAPIEYMHEPKPETGTVVSQREVGIGKDHPSFGTALQSVLRSDSSVIALGELFADDDQTIPSAVEAAAAGLLIFATIHAPSVSVALERIINAFPPEKERSLRKQLVSAFEGGLSLRLVPGATEGAIEPAAEVLFKNTAVENHLGSGDVTAIWDVERSDDKMQTLESDLNRLLSTQRISRDDALRAAVRKSEIVAA